MPSRGLRSGTGCLSSPLGRCLTLLCVNLAPPSLYSSLDSIRAARDLRKGLFLGVLKEYARRGDKYADRKPSPYCFFHIGEENVGERGGRSL